MKKKSVVPPVLPLPARQLMPAIQALFKLSRSESERVIHEGSVAVNGRVRTQRHWKLETGDLIELDYEPLATVSNRKSIRAPIDILFDDEDLVVVNKPANMLTVPTPHREKHTVQSFLTNRIQKEKPKGMAFCVHRLDRGVSGVLVFAKSLETAEALRSQFAARKPERQYIAIVHGSIEEESGTIRSFLATDEELNRYSVEDETQGELAITHFRREIPLRNATMISVRLETGRRNQIRVHMAEKGNPILGDPRYGRYESHPAWPFKRLALHAESLALFHPRTGQELRFRTEWPQEFRECKRKGAFARRRND